MTTTTVQTTEPSLSTSGAVSLYIGALLGPSLLLLPGLAAAIAGPASVLVWLGLLALSGLFAWIFTSLARVVTAGGGVAAYVTAAFGYRLGKAVGLCFLSGVVLGAPVVCLVGGQYVADLLGGSPTVAIGVAVGLLILVVLLTLGGARVGQRVQFGLVVVLVVLVVVAVTGSARAMQYANWTPFLPHGSLSLGRAASVLMLSFVGWEAIAPMTNRMKDPRRQLPRVITIAFIATSVIYLALAVATIAVLGGVSTSVPLAALLRVALGSVGGIAAAVIALALTLAATNAYLTGAAQLLTELRPGAVDRSPRSAVTSYVLQAAIVITGALVLAAVAVGLVDTAELVALPTALFLFVYLGCTASAVRLLRGPVRIAGAVACLVVSAILCFSGWALIPLLLVLLVAAATNLPPATVYGGGDDTTGSAPDQQRLFRDSKEVGSDERR